MLEDSISCSPCNEKKLSRSRRFHKRTKRKCQSRQSLGAVPSDDNISRFLPSLDDLYEDCTSNSRMNTTQIEHFNPFENEKILAAAEKGKKVATNCNLSNFISKGFVTLNNIKEHTDLEQNKELSVRRPSSSSPSSQRVLGTETQFGITESEFVRFCNEAEVDPYKEPQAKKSYSNSKSIVDDILKDFCSSSEDSVHESKPHTSTFAKRSIVEEILNDFCGSTAESDAEIRTPNIDKKKVEVTKSIVDAILEDFCGSPYNESPQKPDSDDSTPVFRFKSQTIRTYSGIRQRKSQRNINKEFNVLLPYDDGNTSDSSSLSIQEDFTQSVVPQLDTVDLNNSVKLCENLANLSSYFSQTALAEKTTSSFEKKKEPDFSAILNEIIELKKRSYTIKRNSSEEDFFGFSNDESDSHDSSLKELLEDEDDVLQLINCDSLCYEKVEAKNSFAINESDFESPLRNANAKIQEANLLISSMNDSKCKAKHSTTEFQSNCDMNKDISKNTSVNSITKEEELFDDIDIWKDNECLLNYKTQKQPSYPAKPAESQSCFLVAELENSTEENNNKCAIKRRNDQETIFGMEFAKSYNLHKFSHQSVIDPCASASLQLKEALGGLNETSKRYPNEYEKEKNIASTSTKHITNTFVMSKEVLSSSNFLGFATASKKPITISDAAKLKANKLLDEFEVEEQSKRMKEELGDDNEINQPLVERLSTARMNPKDKDNSSSLSFVGFSTASKKPISISTKAKQKADLILKKFEEEENEKISNNNFADEKQAIIPTCKQTTKTPSDARHPCDDAISREVLSSAPVMVGLFTASTAKQNENRAALQESKKNERQKVLVGSTECQRNKESISGFVGFCTASKKPISISVEAKQKADQILKKFEQNEADEKTNAVKELVFEKGTQRSPDEVSEEVRRKGQNLLLDIEFFEEAFEDELIEIERSVPQNDTKTCFDQKRTIVHGTNGGFQTASNKSIHISDDAKRLADQLFQKVDNEVLSQEFLRCIESDVGKEVVMRVEQVDGASSSPQQFFHMNPSTEYEHLHDDGLHSKCNNLESEKINSSTLNTNIMVAKTDLDNARTHETNEDDERDVLRISNRSKSLKRKHDVLHSEEMAKTPVHSRHRLSCDEKSPLLSIENGVIRRASSMPLKESTKNSVFISRKNLLSLSKKKKLNSPGQKNTDCPSMTKTPEKVQSLANLHCNANMTPNLKEFFDSVSTSTPRFARGSQTNHSKSIDPDFQRIQWENSNSSLRACGNSFKSDANEILSQVSPSPKERIERLKMYGEPPPISPILMVNKCRTSGLRKGRSLMKP